MKSFNFFNGSLKYAIKKSASFHDEIFPEKDTNKGKDLKQWLAGRRIRSFFQTKDEPKAIRTRKLILYARSPLAFL